MTNNTPLNKVTPVDNPADNIFIQTTEMATIENVKNQINFEKQVLKGEKSPETQAQITMVRKHMKNIPLSMFEVTEKNIQQKRQEMEMGIKML